MAATQRKTDRQTLKHIDQRVRLLQQQQQTFIQALVRTRVTANDTIRPVKSLAQVRNYLDNNCTNNIDRRILTLFLDICADMAEFCIQLESMQNDNRSAKGIIEQTLILLNPTNDLSGLRAKYPHNVLNHLSCDEARNFYGGIVSIIPIVMDNICEALSKVEKTQPHMEYSETTDRLAAIQRDRQNQRKAGNQG
ncbi:sperm acrosome-associated protein 9 [Mantella aurantiaca]